MIRANEATDIIANTKGIESKEMHKIITKSLSSSRSSVTPILLDRDSDPLYSASFHEFSSRVNSHREV